MEDYRPSIVEYFSKQDKSSCGYCSSSNGSSTYGLHAHTLRVEDYQEMIDRGWRRCGKYCYKSIMDCSCCPLYTIRCAAKEFRLSRSQKKILKRFNNFLTTGAICKSKSSVTTEVAQPMEVHYLEKDNVKGDSSQLINILTVLNTPNTKIDAQETVSSKSDKTNPEEHPKLENLVSKDHINKKSKCMKAKYIRIERKRQKLQKLGLTEEEISKKLVEKKKHPVIKTIEDYVNEVSGKKQVHNLKRPRQKFPSSEAPPNSLKSKPLLKESAVELQNLRSSKISLVRSCPRSEEFNSTFGDSFELYKKYQKFIHKDPPEKLTQHQFERFLITSPLQIKLVLVNSTDFKKLIKESASLFAKYQKAVHHESDEDCDVLSFMNFLVDTPLEASQGYGSYHQQYWLDDKLIAVGVIDILPKCLSSVYFFCDPDYAHLSLGTYGALREIEFTRKLSSCFPDLVYYYMGFYIHSCVKMKYKGAFKPSFLLCPEIYTWHPIKECLPKLDVSKYSRLNDNPLATDPDSNVSVSDVLILYNRTVMPLVYYLIKKKCDSHEREKILEYARLVGKSCARNMVLFRM